MDYGTLAAIGGGGVWTLAAVMLGWWARGLVDREEDRAEAAERAVMAGDLSAARNELAARVAQHQREIAARDERIKSLVARARSARGRSPRDYMGVLRAELESREAGSDQADPAGPAAGAADS